MLNWLTSGGFVGTVQNLLVSERLGLTLCLVSFAEDGDEEVQLVTLLPTDCQKANNLAL